MWWKQRNSWLGLWGPEALGLYNTGEAGPSEQEPVEQACLMSWDNRGKAGGRALGLQDLQGRAWRWAGARREELSLSPLHRRLCKPRHHESKKLDPVQ